MAKKTPTARAKSPSTRKKKTPKKGGKGKNYGLVIFLVVAVVVIGLVALYMIGERTKKEVLATKSAQEQRKEARQETAPPAISDEIASSKKPKETKPSTTVQRTTSDPDAPVETPHRNESITRAESVDDYYFTSSFDFGWPSYTSDEQIVEHEAFTLRYNEATEQADWVVYKLTKENLQSSFVSRTDNFRQDPMVRTESAHSDDYKNSEFDRGHLAPAADFGWSEEAMSQSFYMSNMSPQVPAFSRGIWKKLENKVREWALTNDELYVVTGPVFEKRYKTVGKNKVGIPAGFYKIILDIKKPDLKAIGFFIPNAAIKDELYIFATSIDEIEQITGLDFFPLLPDDLENALESTFDWSLWK